MQKALIYHPDPRTSRQLETDMASCGWAIDTCGGMMEMLRLIQESDYEIVVLISDRMNVEMSTLMRTIRTLQKKPRIIINLAGTIDCLGIDSLADDGAVIRGALTSEKLLKAAQEKS
jgi:DNA-binding response OmpR family regulator